MKSGLTPKARARAEELQRQRVRLILLLACVAAGVFWVIGDLFGDGIREWSASHTVASAVGVSLVLVGAGSAGYFATSAIRRRRMDDAITATGFAAIVDCLAEMDRMLLLAMARPVDVRMIRDEHLECEGGRRVYRWYHRMSPASAEVDDAPRTCTDPELMSAVAGDCIRMLMAALRGWADLLSRTNSGIEAMAALGEIRIRLAHLVSDPVREARTVAQISMVARYMSLVFDRASGTMPYRANLNTGPPPSALPAGVHWPTEDLTVSQARHHVEELDPFLVAAFEPLPELQRADGKSNSRKNPQRKQLK